MKASKSSRVRRSLGDVELMSGRAKVRRGETKVEEEEEGEGQVVGNSEVRQEVKVGVTITKRMEGALRRELVE